eukprot:11059430-Lingulodinium_polyedra.AAC.1
MHIRGAADKGRTHMVAKRARFSCSPTSAHENAVADPSLNTMGSKTCAPHAANLASATKPDASCFEHLPQSLMEDNRVETIYRNNG